MSVPYSRQVQSTAVGEVNRLTFLVQQILNASNFATLARVVACSNAGGLSPTGTVDVQPLVNQLDAAGNPVPHDVVYGCIYFRLQGGANAVIVDPEPGDVGIVVFADRDISSVKAARGQANPGSARRNDFADGMYLGGWSATVPTQYVQFVETGGINMTDSLGNTVIMGAAGVTINGVLIDRSGNVSAPGEVTAKASGASSVTLTGHSHAQAADSHGDAEQPTNAPTPGT